MGLNVAAVPITLEAALADRFRVEKEIGSGGWAVVYLAEDLKLGRRVAIKVLRPEHSTEAGAQRFEREVEVAARLHHPHLLPLLDSGFECGYSYYVMPFVEGESLRDRLDREGPLQIREAMRIAREVADALSYAHSQGVIHRDIKPGNIMMESGHAVVTDFGIAAVTQNLTLERLTDTGEAPGTPHYMSPEQVEGESEIDGRTDIYSLGCVLYEMLAGEPPISGSRMSVVLARKLVGEIPRLRVARESVPEVLERVVHRALARVPADRFQEASEMAEALGSIRTEVPTEVEEGLSRRRLAGKVAVTTATILGALALTLFVGFLTTTAFDIKLQMPESFDPSRSDHLAVGARALLPVVVFALATLGILLGIRLVMRRVSETLTKVRAFSGATRAIDKHVLTRGTKLLASARPSTLGDTFFVALIGVSSIVLVRFGDLLSVLWSSETAILACEYKPLHRSFLLTMVVLITSFGVAWINTFPWLERRAIVRARVAFARWGSLAWIIGLLIVWTLPWRIINADAERLRIDGQPAYLLDQSETEVLVFDPARGFAEARALRDDLQIERLHVRGHPFEGLTAFESGVPMCLSLTSTQ
ncbi:MAG: protein kinase [Gemmatimonadota bacterium]